MKQILLLIAIFFILEEVRAQVTIGSEMAPKKGTLLDLKENDALGVNSTKGLLLPRVQLTTISSLDDIGAGLDKDEHVGLTIYVPQVFGSNRHGVYVWTGLEWKGLTPNTSSKRFHNRNNNENGYTAQDLRRYTQQHPSTSDLILAE